MIDLGEIKHSKIAIVGKMSSGKTYYANKIIKKDPAYKNLSFANKIKDIASEFGLSSKSKK